MKKIGILLDPSDGDLLLNGGALAVGNTLYQNQFLILKAQKGDLKEFPMMGAGIDDLSNDNDIVEWKRKIREELKKDGLTVTSVVIDTKKGELIIKADYE